MKINRPLLLSALSLLILNADINAQIRFDDVSSSSGIYYSGESWGASWGHIDDDPLPDLFSSNHRNRPSVWLNGGSDGFSDVTPTVDTHGFWIPNGGDDTHGGSWSDFDNDGDQDLYLSAGGNDANHFMVNENALLIDYTQQLDPLISNWRGRLPMWIDFSDDGLLDFVMGSQNNVPSMQQLASGDGFLDVSGATNISCNNSQTVMMADVNTDGRLDIICMNSGFPARIYDTSTLPFTNITSMIPRRNAVQDVAIADFDNDLAVDFFGVRGAKRLSGATQTGPQSVEAHLIGDFSAEKRFSFVAEGEITVFLATEYKMHQSTVKIGASGYSPQAPIMNRREITFTLSSDDPANFGLKSHNPSRDVGIYVGYAPGTKTWTLAHSPGGGWATSYYRVENTGPVSDVVAQGMTNNEQPVAPFLFVHSNGELIDDSLSAGLSAPLSCVSTAAGDFDNDMDQDLYLVCRGAVENLPNLLYENLGDGTFVQVPGPTGAEGDVGVNVGKGDSVAVADYDVDGFLDLLVTNGLQLLPYPPNDVGGRYNLLRNRGNDNHWIELDLVGVNSNRDAVGAKVYATALGKVQMREQNGGYHRWTQNHQRMHFGLGSATEVDIQVVWPAPANTTDTFNAVPVDGLYRITEGGLIERVHIEGQTPEVSIEDLSVEENVANGQVELTFNLSQASDTMITLDVTSSDGSAVSPDDYAVMSQSLSFMPGEIEQSLTLNIEDDTLAEGPESFSIELSNPQSVGIATPSATVTLIDDDAPGISVDDITIDENDANGTAVFTLSLSHPSSAIVSVDVTTEDDSATAPADYVPNFQLISFAPGETEHTLEVDIIDDEFSEIDEGFVLQLSNAENGVIDIAQARATIIDNDLPTLNISDASVAEDIEGGILSITLNLSGVSGDTVRVEVNSSDATATAPDDYSVVSQSVSFAPGEVEQTLDLVIANNADHEGEKHFTLTLSNPDNANLGQDSATITIVDDDAPRITIADLVVTEDVDGGIATLTVGLSEVSSSTVSVEVNSSDGDAQSPDDYTAVNQSLSFAPGDLEQTFSLLINDDSLAENDETLQLQLSNAVLGVIENASATVTIIDNDAPSITITDASVSENQDALVTLSLSAPSTSEITVDVTSSDDSAVSPDDYTAVSLSVSFAPGEMQQDLTLAIIDDAQVEDDESFTLTLSNPVAAVLGDTTATVSIINDDHVPCGAPSYNKSMEQGVFLWKACNSDDWTVRMTAGGRAVTYEGDISSALAVLGVTEFSTEGGDLVDRTSNPSNIHYRLSMANAGQDGFSFRFPSDTGVCFSLDTPPGIPVYVGPNRTLAAQPFDLSNLAPCSSSSLPGIWVSDIETPEDIAAGVATLEVKLSKSSSDIVSVIAQTQDGTATSPDDYTALAATTLIFAPGEISLPLSIELMDDATQEGDERFTVSLSSPENATLIDATATIVIIDDESPDPVDSPRCGTPTINRSQDRGVFIWQECSNDQWRMRVTAGGGSALTYRGIIASDQDFSKLGAVSLEGSDSLRPTSISTPTTGPIDFKLIVGGTGQDGINFKVPANADTCLELTASDGLPIWVGADRVEMSGSVHLRDFVNCSP